MSGHQGRNPSIRARLGSLASRLYPGLDEALWTSKRDREMLAEIEAGAYAGNLRELTPLADPRRLNSTGRRVPHLVVVPQVGPNIETWKPAGGNFFYEIAQSAREYAGAKTVTIFGVEAGEPAASWHQRLIRYLVESGATHLIAQVEADPNSGQTLHSWDTFWSQLLIRWDGVLLGVVTDSSYKWITINARRLGRMSERFLLVDICMPMDGSMRKGRREVGPVNMPVSNESLAVVDEHTRGLPKIHDVAFMGVLYPYRVEMLDSLRALGVNVAVNPHRADKAADLASSQANQPSWLDYMTALAQSHLAINFSQSSAGPFQQLKTRVLEASSVGCVVLTDDVDRTELFWVPMREYGYFATPADIPALANGFLSNPESLKAAQQAAKLRARAINVTSFWGGIDEVLGVRGLSTFKSNADELDSQT